MIALSIKIAIQLGVFKDSRLSLRESSATFAEQKATI